MSERPKEEMADTTPPAVDDHVFVAPEREPWGRCVQEVSDGEGGMRRCGLGEAAHAQAMADWASASTKS
jgi:hypothetical protein